MRYGVVYTHTHRTPITTAVITSTSTSARQMEALLKPRTADWAETPTSTNSALLCTVVDSAQNGMAICRVTAPVMRGATWLMNNPQTTTASTPPRIATIHGATTTISKQDLESMASIRESSESTNRGVVLRDHDRFVAATGRWHGRRRNSSGNRLDDYGEVHLESGSVSFLAFNPDESAALLHDAVHRRQAETGSAILTRDRLACLGEAVEQGGDLFGGYPGPGIDDLDA